MVKSRKSRKNNKKIRKSRKNNKKILSKIKLSRAINRMDTCIKAKLNKKCWINTKKDLMRTLDNYENFEHILYKKGIKILKKAEKAKKI